MVMSSFPLFQRSPRQCRVSIQKRHAALAKVLAGFALFVYRIGQLPAQTSNASPQKLAVTRHALQNNGRIEGTCQQLAGEGVNLNSGSVFTGDFLVAGTPTVQLNGSPTWSGQQTGTGSTNPTGYTITVNSGVQMRYLVQRTDPVTLATVATPPSPTGTRQVTINSASDASAIGNWATVKDLTLNSNAGNVTVPAGTYGTFNASNSNNTGFVFGTAGASTASVYNLQALTLNSNSRLTLLGPVIINVAGQVAVNSNTAIVGSTSSSAWLQLNDAGAGVTLNSGSVIYGAVNAPAGTINVNGKIAGTATCNQLTVNSGGVITSGVVPNQAPVVSAGSNQTITLPAGVNLAGSVSDDGQPAGAAVTSTWSKSSGPGTVSFGNTAAPRTTASFSAAGTYVLQLSASDTALSSSATVTITVNPANQAPVVKAGSNQTVSLPNTASLSGSVSDDGLPAGASVTSAWSKTSGPGPVTFANAASPQTTASFSVAGTYVLQLSASDTALSSNSTVTITVNPQNQPPAVNAGAAQTIRPPATASLNGSATDDGLPSGGKLTTTWSQVNGPGTTSFGNTAAAQTTASFSVAGTYTLRLSASDTALTSTSDVTVTVLPANQAPVVSAGSNQTITLPAAINLGGSVSDDGLPTGAAVTSTWSKVSGPGAVTFANSAAAQTSVSVDRVGTYVLQLSASDTALSSSATVTIVVKLSNQPPRVDAGAAQTITLPANATLSGSVTDDGLPAGATVTDTWTKVSGPGNVTFSSPNAAQTNALFDRAGVYVLSLTGDDTQFARVAQTVVTVQAANQPPQVSAGPAQTVEIGTPLTLNGTATDDGLPRGGGLSIAWSQVAGPGTASFATAFQALTGVTFNAVGAYTLRLKASDSLLTSTSDVQVTITARANKAPVVHAGPAQALQGTHTTLLVGSVNDDGLPAGSILRNTWTQLSGPGVVGFANPADPQTTVTLGATGTYVLQLSSTDGQLSASDQVSITVSELNRPPQPHAGSVQTITLPATATLAGTATDDGLPTPATLAFAWSQVSGPGAAIFSSASTAATAVSFPVAGDYVFALSVSDGQLSAGDQTTVHVLASCNHPAPAGLVGFWSGDDTADDLLGDSPATLLGSSTYGPGEVGDAFTLPGNSGSGVQVHGTPATNSGVTGSGLTVECWINPANPAAQQALVEWNNGGSYRTHFWIYGGTGTLFLHLIGSGGDGILYSPAGTVTANGWQHVAWTYDKASGVARLYENGAIVTEQNVGSFTPATDGDLFFGQRNGGYPFQGGMDEVSLYQRALSPTEIQTIYMAGSDGKCRAPLNHRPVVSAGSNRTLPLSYQLALQGTVTDDGLPAGGMLATTWTQVSGPGQAAFTDASSPASKVGFPTAGTYVFQLAATDSELSAASSVTFTVLPDDQAVPPTVVISPYRATWRYAIYPYGQVPDNVGSPDFDDSGYQTAPGSFGSGGGCPVQANTQTAWPNSTEIVLRRVVDLPASITNVRVSGTVDNDIAVYINGVDMSNGFIGHENCAQLDDTRINIVATTVLKPGPNLFVLRGRDRGGESFIDAQLLVDQPITAVSGNNFTATGGAIAVLDGSASTSLSQKPLTYQWNQAAGPSVPLDLSDPARPRFVVPRLPVETPLVFKLIVSDGLVVSSPASITVTVSASAPMPGGGSTANQAPVVSAGANQSLATAFTAILQGTATDDGLPTGSTVKTTWSVVSGPGSVTFTDPAATTTQAQFARTGVYVLQLLASDGELIGASQVTVAVGASVNLPPQVNAGPSQRVQLPQLATLAGRAGDDGLPAGSVLTSTWTQVSGPGVATFANPGRLATTATFDQPGSYVLRLSVSDGQLAASSDVNVLVTSAAGGNQPPTISVGDMTRTIAFGQTLTVDPQLDDDGLPNGTLDMNWVQLDGPATVDFSDASATPGLGYYATALAFPAAGTYYLRASASDSLLVSNADLTVTVTPGVSQPPIVSLASNAASFSHGQPVTLSATASDPDGWIVSVAFNADGQPIGSGTLADDGTYNLTWTGATVGSHTLSAVATDNSGTTAASNPVTITVGPAVPFVALSYPGAYSAFTVGGSAVNLQASARPGGDNSPVTQVDFAVNGQTIGSCAQAPYVLAWNPAAPGDYTLVATATDAAGQRTVSAGVPVRAIAAGVDPGAPTTVDLSSPVEGQEVTAPVPIVGTVDGPTLASWRLEYRRRSNTCTDWTTFAVGSSAVDESTLGVFDPTLVPNGLYDLRLTALSAGGQSDVSSASVVVDGGMKVGRFTVAFNDLTVPLAGLPITVTRAYDSTEKCPGDFGVGWNLDVSTVKLEKNYPIGSAWYADFEPQDPIYIPTYFLEDSGPHVITITFPDGKVYKFQPQLTLADGSPVERFAAPIGSSEPLKIGFQALPGTQGKLTARGIPHSLYLSDDAYLSNIQFLDDPYDGNLFSDATGWDFTTQDGKVFTFDAQGKLVQMADRNGNTLTFTHTGIYHSSGRNVQYVRDAQDRISAITDPMGQQLVYTYDAAGNLATFTDRTQAVSRYTYDAFHNLKNLIDPRGVTPLRNDYDADGRLVRSTDATGKAITYGHNVDGKVESITDRLGHTTTHRYDNQGNVLSTTDAKGGVISYTYDANNNKLTQTDPLGNTTRYAYDANGLLLQIADPLGHATCFTYDDSARVQTITDARGKVSATNAYDAAGNLLSVTDALGHATAYTYDSSGNRLTERDPLGNVTHHEYDAYGHENKNTDAQGHATVYSYDLDSNRLTETTTRTRADGAVETITTAHAYDADGRLAQTTDPLGNNTQTAYNAIGKPAQSVDSLGRATTYAYDAQGQLLSTIAPDGTTSQTYDAEGHRLTSTDQNGHATTYGYDELNRLVKTTLADGSFTQSAFDAAGRVTTLADANGNVTVYSYNAAGQRISGKDALGHISIYAFDENGNQASSTDALGHATTYAYDDANRRIGAVFTDGSTKTTAYDAAGRRVAEIDPLGRVTQYSYDSLGHLVVVTDNTGQKASYVYDELGNETSQTDANGHTTTYAYNGLGQRTARTLPGGQAESMTYDAMGNIGARRDFNGRLTTFSYDAANRLLARVPDASLNEPTVSFTYSPAGQRLTMNDASGMTSYGYDNRNRLVSKATPEGTLAYTYDPVGHVLSVASSNPNGTRVGYNYDGLGRLSAVNDTHTGQTNYVYDTLGNLTGHQYPNQVNTTYGYDTLNRLGNLSVTALINGTNHTLASYTYTLDAAGQRTGVIELGGRTVTYGYDNLGRLQSEQVSGATGSSPKGQVVYSLDAVGNRLGSNSTLAGVPSASASFDANDHLTSDTYDANGNTRQSPGNGNTDTYDSFDRLVGRSNGSSGTTQIIYDGDGHKVRETTGGIVISYVVDELNPTGYAQAAEELTNGIVTRVYTWGSQLISQEQYSASSGQWNASFYGYDGHGNVRLLINSSGVVTDRYDYDAFGNLLIKQGTTSNLHLYCGEELDQTLGLYNLRARLMNPLTGRFWTQDNYEGTNGDPFSLHKYLFSSASPINRIDPSGHEDLADLSIATSIANTVNSTEVNIAFAVQDQLLYGGNAGAESLAIGAVVQLGSPIILAYAEKFIGYLGGAFTSLGRTAELDYRKTFFGFFPALSQFEDRIFVHHAVEQQVLIKYPNLFSEEEINSIENLRGIPSPLNNTVHLSDIRKLWNDFYAAHPTATRQEVVEWANVIDGLYGYSFIPEIDY